ncbi:unnamed protein product [Didymodactylos carnosus]|uniref:Uncharacterized protein n=1 Tax=Didymodactylos carnosus TaxID=1234261 RepID=A0A8S2SD95_9BILA|nr:unnamed protein product [Didymodactylos carnosus]CAF4221371.1 unnamed protein product [Didymodactylos carnosus]
MAQNTADKHVQFDTNKPRIFWSAGQASDLQHEQILPVVLKKRVLLPYTPPDSLMNDLFSAIQRKTWTKAKSLCYELILCDSRRNTYRDLYILLDKITDIIDVRVNGPREESSDSSLTSCDDGDLNDDQRRRKLYRKRRDKAVNVK